MKFAVSSDWHLHNYSGAQVRVLPDGTNSRLKDILDCCDWMVDQAVERGCTAFLHGGDVTHNRKVLHISAWARATAAFRRWGERIPFYVNEGNHDEDQSGDGTSTVGALAGIVAGAYTTPVVAHVGRVPVGWLPYLEDPAVVRAETARLAKRGARVLVAHLGIGDPRHADCLPIDYETPGRISVADLNPELFDQVFLGHYHTAQDLAPNVRYVGSPLQLSFKEAGITKGFWTYDTDTGEVEFVENTASPQFHVLTETYTAADLAHLPGRDHVWVKNANPDVAAAAAEASAGREVPIRVERAPVVTAGQARLSPEARTERETLAEYVRIASPQTEEGEAQALVGLGAQLLDETR